MLGLVIGDSRLAPSVRANAAHQAADAAFFSPVVCRGVDLVPRRAHRVNFLAKGAEHGHIRSYTLMQAVAMPAARPTHPRHGGRRISRCNMPNNWRGWAVSALMLLLLLAQLRGCSV